MKKILYLIVFLLSTLKPLLGEVYHHYPDLTAEVKAYVWETIPAEPFNEMMISWNGAKPTNGDYRISVMVLTDEWSSWMLYMPQNGNEQENSIKIHQDRLSILDGKKGVGFRIRLEATKKANLSEMWSIHVATVSLKGHSDVVVNGTQHFYHLDVPLMSYLAHFNGSQQQLSKISHVLGKEWKCWKQAADNFDVIFRSLEKKIPVVVKVKGPLLDSVRFVERLLIVKGFNPLCGEVICVDPAFAADEEAEEVYLLPDFAAAWMRCGKIVYLFEQ